MHAACTAPRYPQPITEIRTGAAYAATGSRRTRAVTATLPGMRILVTGGAGFIGSNFVLRTRATRPDWTLTVLDAMTYAANPRSLAPVLSDLGGDGSVELVKGSVADGRLVDGLVADHDVVVHF